MLDTLRWLSLTVLPTVLAALLVRYTDREREPLWLVSTTFALGAFGAAVVLTLEIHVARFTAMTISAQQSGEGPALLFLFAFAAPIRELAKVAACWPAFRSRHFDEPYDGVVYAGAAALGFAAVENAFMLRLHHDGAVGVARALLSVPAHLFFACLWGYGLGRARRLKEPGGGFFLLFSAALVSHALYIHLVYGRPAGALVVAVPVLLAMSVVSYFLARDLRQRGDSQSPVTRLSLASIDVLSGPPSLRRVREAMGATGRPIALRWIAIGTAVMVGAMILGVAGSVALGYFARIDFSLVDEHDVSTTAPVALLGAGLLSAFPFAGFLVARASGIASLLEPAASAGLAIGVGLPAIGVVAPVAVVFGLALTPIGFALACLGAWVGRT